MMEQIGGMFGQQGVPAAFSANPFAPQQSGQGGQVPWLAALSELGKGVAQAGAQIGGARQAEAEAKSAKVAGRLEAERIRQKGRAVVATGRANVGASGTTGAGSPLIVELENLKLNELDAATAIYASKLEAVYKKTEARQRYAAGAGDFLAGITRASTAYKKAKAGESLL